MFVDSIGGGEFDKGREKRAQMAMTARESLAGAADPGGLGAPAVAEALALAQAHRVLRFIRESRQAFPTMRDLADHPGWEILLHIFIGTREGRTISAVDLCELTGCWRPLALRYVELMSERAMIERDFVPGNAEAAPLRLSVEAEERLMALLSDFAHNWFDNRPTTAGA